MINRVREMGQGFRARCPVCRDVTLHRPVGDGREPDPTRCSRCGRVYEAPHSATPLPATVQPPPPHRRRIPDGVEQQWHNRLAEVDPDDAMAYRADQVLQVGQWLDHPTFGLGVVRKLLPPATAEVHFQQGFKRLRCRV